MVKFWHLLHQLRHLLPKRRPLFVLSVGAQKSGTSWLRGTLKQHEICNLGLIKEYHIWDKSVPKEILGSEFSAVASWMDEAQASLRESMLQDEGYYFKYFKNMISRKRRVTGDFTPSYSLLQEEELRQLTRKLLDAGFDVAVVFLLRDPVDRCWSAFRSNYRDLDQPLPTEGLMQEFRAFYTSPAAVSRTRYEEIISKLLRMEKSKEIAGTKGNVSVVLQGYEQMITGEVDALAKALRVKAARLTNPQVYNASPSQSLPESEVTACMSFFAQTYAYCTAQFPSITQYWRNSV
jgi:hypothetical protein